MASEHGGMCTPCTANDLKKNLYGMMRGRPCKIMETAHSKTGKHGHAKVAMTGIDVLNGKKIQDVQPAHAQMYFANIEKTTYQLMHLDKDNNIAQLIDDNNQEYEVPLEGEFGEELSKEYDPERADVDYQVTVLVAPVMDAAGNISRQEKIVGWKAVKADE
jgi:translation initiation factor 5A